MPEPPHIAWTTKGECWCGLKHVLLATRPYAYACPRGCGCIWRDNEDGTISLFGPNSKSCAICEVMALKDLLPVWRTMPELTTGVQNR